MIFGLIEIPNKIIVGIVGVHKVKFLLHILEDISGKKIDNDIKLGIFNLLENNVIVYIYIKDEGIYDYSTSRRELKWDYMEYKELIKILNG